LSTLLLLIVMTLALPACGPETLLVGLDPTTLQKHDSPVESVAFSPDGALLAVGSRDGTVRVWRVVYEQGAGWTLLHTRRISTGETQAAYSHDVAFSPDSRTLAFGLPDGTVQLWRLSGGRSGGQSPSDLEVASLHTLQADDSRICSLDFAPDGRTVAAGAWNGSVHVWRVADGVHLQSLIGHSGGVVSVAFSPDSATLVSASLDGTTTLWDISTGTVIHQREDASATTGVAFSPDGSMLAVATSTGDRQLWSAVDWSLVRELESTRGGMGNIAFSPDGAAVAAGNAWHEMHWWRVADGALLDAVRGHKDSVNSVAFSPDGQMLASGSLDGTVKIWRVPGQPNP
jgi:WD40 repeat protein